MKTTLKNKLYHRYLFLKKFRLAEKILEVGDNMLLYILNKSTPQSQVLSDLLREFHSKLNPQHIIWLMDNGKLIANYFRLLTGKTIPKRVQIDTGISITGKFEIYPFPFEKITTTKKFIDITQAHLSKIDPNSSG